MCYSFNFFLNLLTTYKSLLLDFHSILIFLYLCSFLSSFFLQDNCNRLSINHTVFKGEVQSRITINSKERIKISLQIGAKMMKIGKK